MTSVFDDHHFRVPWTARKYNQSILKEISPGCSLEGLMLKLSSNTLATWCKELTHWKGPWCWERQKAKAKGTSEDEMVGWHHRLNRHESEQTPGDSGRQGGLACCNLWGHKESNMTWWLNNNNFQVYFLNELIPSEYSWQQFLGTFSCKWISTHIYACSYWGLSSIFPGGTVIKIPSTNTGDAERYGLIPGSRY